MRPISVSVGEDGGFGPFASLVLFGAWTLPLAGAALLPALPSPFGSLLVGAEGAPAMPRTAQPAGGRELLRLRLGKIGLRSPRSPRAFSFWLASVWSAASACARRPFIPQTPGSSASRLRLRSPSLHPGGVNGMNPNLLSATSGIRAAGDPVLARFPYFDCFPGAYGREALNFLVGSCIMRMFQNN